MAKIDNLIFKAKQCLVGNKEKLIYVMIGYEKPNSVSCTVWNGAPGQARTIDYECDTRDEALAKIEEIVTEYPSNNKTINGIDMDKGSTILISVDDGD